MRGTPDEAIREVIWQSENKVIACAEHLEGLMTKGFSVVKVDKIRYPIECGFITCSKIGFCQVSVGFYSCQKSSGGFNGLF